MNEHEQAIADRDWWQSLLPPGWRLHGWTFRMHASAYPPKSDHIVEINGRLLADMRSSGPGGDFMNDVACLVSAMREVGRVPGDTKNNDNDEWWSQEFLVVERHLVARGLLLEREEWIKLRLSET